MANVIFKVGTLAQYNLIEVKDQNTLYWLTDEQALYKGDKLFGTGKTATQQAAGLLSAADKAALDRLIAGDASALSAADASILIGDGDNGKTIGVRLSEDAENILSVKSDGLFAGKVKLTLEKKDEDADDYAAVYRLKVAYGEDEVYADGEINIPKDVFFKNSELKVVEEANKPYDGAEVGDPYLDIELTDGTQSYIPMKGLLNTVVAGLGITVENNTVSIKLDEENANGLTVTDAGLGLAPVTATSPGAMIAADKKFLDSIPSVYEKVKYAATNMLPGARFDVDGKEIRVMFPKDAAFVKPTGTAAGRDNDCYYFGLRAYAPSDDVDGFREASGEVIPEDTVKEFFPGSSSGIDEFGRKYDVCWFPVARCNEDGTWTYYGEVSEAGKYVGWYHTIEWYKGDVCVGSETVRINLTNESCHNSLKKFLGADNTSAALVWVEM